MGKEEGGWGRRRRGRRRTRRRDSALLGLHLTVLSSLLADHSNLENNAVCSNFRGALAPLCPLS